MPEVPSDLDSVISEPTPRKGLMFAFRVSATRWVLFGSEIEKAAMPMELEMPLIKRKKLYWELLSLPLFLVELQLQHTSL